MGVSCFVFLSETQDDKWQHAQVEDLSVLLASKDEEISRLKETHVRQQSNSISTSSFFYAHIYCFLYVISVLDHLSVFEYVWNMFLSDISPADSPCDAVISPGHDSSRHDIFLSHIFLLARRNDDC